MAKRSTAAPLKNVDNISEKKSASQNFTSRANDSIAKIGWECRRGTKCYTQRDIWKKLRVTHDPKRKIWQNITMKGRKNENKKKDEGSRNNSYRSKQSKIWIWKALLKNRRYATIKVMIS